MILERKSTINLYNVKEKYGGLIEDLEAGDSIGAIFELIEMQQVYSAAMNEISTKLEILDDEFQLRYKHNPIHHIERRLKTPQSIIAKLKKNNLPLDLTSAKHNLTDIAGIRVICNYIEDVYIVEELLTKQTDIKLICRKDYIKNPKENGYRSLHLILTIPVFLSDRTEVPPVEIQIRTIAMDYWASLEHHLRYKNPSDDIESHKDKLRECANLISHIEGEMQNIYNNIK